MYLRDSRFRFCCRLLVSVLRTSLACFLTPKQLAFGILTYLSLYLHSYFTRAAPRIFCPRHLSILFLVLIFSSLLFSSLMFFLLLPRSWSASPFPLGALVSPSDPIRMPKHPDTSYSEIRLDCTLKNNCVDRQKEPDGGRHAAADLLVLRRGVRGEDEE